VNLVFFDMETAGLLERHPTIQIAAIATDDFEEVGSFEAKIKFDVSLADPEALKLNSYDPQVWDDEAIPEIAAVAKFYLFLQRHAETEMTSKRTGRPYKVTRVAGHNAATFDGPRLKSMFERNNQFLPAHPQVLDTLQLALWKTKAGFKSYKLADLCAHFGIETAGAHDALADVRMCAKLARQLMKDDNSGNG
jgi:DNA polymerase III epsilon subunit-like protein